MFSSLKLGRFFGIDVYIHWTFWIIPLLAFFEAFKVGGTLAAAVAAAFVLTAFACILFHEYGHALTARRFGIATRDITLYPIGGVARLERLGNNAWEEFLIALAGPTVNVVIAVLLAFVLMGIGGRSEATPLGILRTLVDDLLLVNLGFVVFNLIPAFPMDGGRIFRSLLVPSRGYLRATEIAVRLGGVFSTLFILAGLVALVVPDVPYISGWLLPIGFFVSLMGRQELAMARFREFQRLRGQYHFDEAPVTVQPAEAVVVKPVEARAGGFTGYLWDETAGRWIEWRNGQPVQGMHTGS